MRPSRRQTQPFTRRWSPGRPSFTVLLVALHVGAFAAQWLLEMIEQDRFASGNWLMQWLALDGTSAADGRYWQFATFPLLHAGPLHVAANLVILYFVGRELEPIIGTRPFVALYLLGTFVGGAMHWLAMPEQVLVGVSGGVAAVVAAYATVLPELELSANLFFIVPVRVRVKLLGVAMLLFGAVCWATSTITVIGPAAVVTGSFIGWIYARQLGFGNPLAIQCYLYERRQRAARLLRMTPEQFMSEEIDPILDKISREGMHRLTRAERKLLEQGRDKIAAKVAAK